MQMQMLKQVQESTPYGTQYSVHLQVANRATVSINSVGVYSVYTIPNLLR